MYYLIGDIHGNLEELMSLVHKVKLDYQEGDTVIFLGDYIDRGNFSFEVVEYLIALAKKLNVVFLKGNHEDMLEKYLKGDEGGEAWLYNGGEATIRSYTKNYGSFKLPPSHADFFRDLGMYYEGDDFIAVHAGLNPEEEDIYLQRERDLLWIREKFFRSGKKWDKTVIFGHTPTTLFSRKEGIMIDEERNIIALDNGIIFGNPLAGLRWPDKKIYYSD
ncbi:MAG: serine/threonine protein phosphatase [Spirochaetae bacterium HGW-Spirochaetae-1]|jgi:serine/threonine protein phosphatase 1|nr:MAG: serine/threonine protein phosphatase [Spirochaetae bacterium HGW-Spirochaetae-1]